VTDHNVTRRRLIEVDKRNLWHPYTEMSQYIEHGQPLVISRAEGSRLYELDGRSFIDGNASWWTSLLGHGHPRLLEVLSRQAATLAHVPLAGIVHEPAAELAQALVGVAPPGLTRVFFSDDGSTSVEVALKLSVQYHYQNGQPGRHKVISFTEAFHGETLGCTALSGVDAFKHPFSRILMQVLSVPSPADGIEECWLALESLVARERDQVAALIIEPQVQGAGGMRIYPPSFLGRLRRLCDEIGAWLIFDEVFSGYGRTGTMWGSEPSGVSPDIMCVAKGFSGGLLPMAATLVTERIFEGFFGARSRAFYYGHTFCGNPLGAAVAREVLRIYHDEQIVRNAAPKAERLAATFGRLGQLPGVAKARSLGMLGALDLVGDSGYLAQAGWRVYEEALQRGAYLRPLGNVVYTVPALNIPDDDLDELLGIIEESVRAVIG